MDHLAAEIWKARDWDHYQFLRGQMDTARKYHPEMMQREIQRMKEMVKTDEMATSRNT